MMDIDDAFRSQSEILMRPSEAFFWEKEGAEWRVISRGEREEFLGSLVLCETPDEPDPHLYKFYRFVGKTYMGNVYFRGRKRHRLENFIRREGLSIIRERTRGRAMSDLEANFNKKDISVFGISVAVFFVVYAILLIVMILKGRI